MREVGELQVEVGVAIEQRREEVRVRTSSRPRPEASETRPQVWRSRATTRSRTCRDARRDLSSMASVPRSALRRSGVVPGGSGGEGPMTGARRRSRAAAPGTVPATKVSPIHVAPPRSTRRTTGGVRPSGASKPGGTDAIREGHRPGRPFIAAHAITGLRPCGLPSVAAATPFPRTHEVRDQPARTPHEDPSQTDQRGSTDAGTSRSG